MPLTIQSLNSDSTFLLTFVPPSASVAANPFQVVLDPWLTGSSHILHPKFALTKLKNAPVIDSLRALPHGDPDLVLISQPKTDHCHEETLRQLPPTSPTTRIYAHPAAVRKIRSWHHFDPDAVQSLPAYEPTDASVVRIPITVDQPNVQPGEMTIALIPAKRDLTGLHNAVGITYRAPKPDEHRPSDDETISILYTPHGVAPDAVSPYAHSHLRSISALPLTVLLHPMDVVRNPRLLGGTITAGSERGVEVARAFRAQVWCSAHDGDKTNTGISVLGLTMRRYDMTEVERLVAQGGDDMDKSQTRLVRLKAGQSVEVTGS